MVRMRAATRRWKIPQVFTDIYHSDLYAAVYFRDVARSAAQQWIALKCGSLAVLIIL